VRQDLLLYRFDENAVSQKDTNTRAVLVSLEMYSVD
jgi:hypothetical protein